MGECPFTVSFFGGRVPLLESTTEKQVGTPILSSLLEDLSYAWSSSLGPSLSASWDFGALKMWLWSSKPMGSHFGG